MSQCGAAGYSTFWAKTVGTSPFIAWESTPGDDHCINQNSAYTKVDGDSYFVPTDGFIDTLKRQIFQFNPTKQH
jgi:hypothetical protein